MTLHFLLWKTKNKNSSKFTFLNSKLIHNQRKMDIYLYINRVFQSSAPIQIQMKKSNQREFHKYHCSNFFRSHAPIWIGLKHNYQFILKNENLNWSSNSFQKLCRVIPIRYLMGKVSVLLMRYSPLNESHRGWLGEKGLIQRKWFMKGNSSIHPRNVFATGLVWTSHWCVLSNFDEEQIAEHLLFAQLSFGWPFLSISTHLSKERQLFK